MTDEHYRDFANKLCEQLPVCGDEPLLTTIPPTRDVAVNALLSSIAVCYITYCWDPPSTLVLWWMSFHVTMLSTPLVTDRPAVNTSLAANACLRRPSTYKAVVQKNNVNPAAKVIITQSLEIKSCRPWHFRLSVQGSNTRAMNGGDSEAWRVLRVKVPLLLNGCCVKIISTDFKVFA